MFNCHSLAFRMFQFLDNTKETGSFNTFLSLVRKMNYYLIAVCFVAVCFSVAGFAAYLSTRDTEYLRRSNGVEEEDGWIELQLGKPHHCPFPSDIMGFARKEALLASWISRSREWKTSQWGFQLPLICHGNTYGLANEKIEKIRFWPTIFSTGYAINGGRAIDTKQNFGVNLKMEINLTDGLGKNFYYTERVQYDQLIGTVQTGTKSYCNASGDLKKVEISTIKFDSPTGFSGNANIYESDKLIGAATVYCKPLNG